MLQRKDLAAAVSATLAAAALTLVATPQASAKTFKWASASDIPTWDIHPRTTRSATAFTRRSTSRSSTTTRSSSSSRCSATGYKQVSPTQVRITLAAGREVPRRVRLQCRRRRVLARAGDGEDLELRRLHPGHRQGRQGRRPHHRHLHQGSEPGAAAPAHRAAHDGQGLGREEQGRSSPRTSRPRTRTSRTATPTAPAPSCSRAGSRT